MFNTLSRSWSLVKASFNVLRSDPELMVLPFISMLGVLLVSIVFIVPAYFGGLFDNLGERGDGLSTQNILGLVVLFLYYLVMYTIIIFSNVALVGAAMMRVGPQGAARPEWPHREDISFRHQYRVDRSYVPGDPRLGSRERRPNRGHQAFDGAAT
jgi:hypothetical protein